MTIINYPSNLTAIIEDTIAEMRHEHHPKHGIIHYVANTYSSLDDSSIDKIVDMILKHPDVIQCGEAVYCVKGVKYCEHGFNSAIYSCNNFHDVLREEV